MVLPDTQYIVTPTKQTSTHLPTPKEWKAELIVVLVIYQDGLPF